MRRKIKKHRNYNGIKSKIHDRLVDKIYENPELLGLKSEDYVYKGRYENIGPYVPDLIFICKTRKTQERGLYKLLVVEVKAQGYGLSIRRAEVKLYDILNSFIRKKSEIIEIYSKRLDQNYPKLQSLYFGYRIAFTNYFGGVDVVKPTTWEDRDI